MARWLADCQDPVEVTFWKDNCSDVDTISLAFMSDVGYQACLKLKISHSIILYDNYLYEIKVMVYFQPGK